MNNSFIQQVNAIINKIESGVYEEGLNELHILSDKTTNLEERLDISRVYLSLGFIEESRDIAESLEISQLSLERELDLKRLKAEISYKEGNFNHALELMHDILEQRSNDEDYEFISQIYFDEGLPEVAYRYITKAIDQNSTVSFYFYQKGLYAFELGQMNDAIEGFKKAIETDENVTVYHLALGEAYYSYGRFEEAIAQYDQVLREHPQQEEALYLKGIALIHIGDIDNGIEYLKKLSLIQQENLDVLISLADAYEKNQDHDLSLETLLRILAIDEYNLPALRRIGELYLHEEEWAKAKEILNKALEIDPDDISLQLMYARILKSYGDVKEAIEQYEFIYKNNIIEEDLCENLGDLYLKSGDIQKAIECYEKQLEQDQNIHVLNQLAACYAETGQLDKALMVVEDSLIINADQEKLQMVKMQIQQLLKSQDK